MSAVTCTHMRHYYIFVNENIPFNKHFESSQKLLKSSFVNEIFKKYSKVPKKLLTFEKTKFTKT